MTKQMYFPTQIGPNHFTYQNGIDIQISCRGRIYDVPAGNTVFFEDVGEYPTVVVATDEVENTFFRFEITERIMRSGNAGQTVVDRTEELLRARRLAHAEIDRSAEATRGLFITLGSGQAMVYQQKRDEAMVVLANPSVDPDEVPHIASEAAMNSVSLLDQAQIIISMSQSWTWVSSQIEQRRLAAKKSVTDATLIEAIESASQVDWSDIEALAQS